MTWTEARGRAAVLERSQGRCELCGVARADGVHHRQPRSAGGTWSPANLLHACGSGTTGCHGAVEAHRDPLTDQPCDTYAMGWHVPRGVGLNAAAVRLAHPVYGPGWWDLQHDGGLRLWAPWTAPRRLEQLPTRKHTRIVRH